MAKIPTELYIYVPKRSAKASSLYTNAWCNLTRKDTGEGIFGKTVLLFLDNANISQAYTDKSGYTGPFDINPRAVGLHTIYVSFEGDEDYEPCKSEEITLVCNPNLASTRIVMNAAPVSDFAPLTLEVTGFIQERYVEAGVPKGRPPAYSLPLDLMVFDPNSTKRLQKVKTTSSYPDGTFEMQYTFTKPGTYSIFVNFLGDAKYISAWSNNGQTTAITVTGGSGPLSWEETITIALTGTKVIKRIISQTEPTAPDGYDRAPEYDLDWGVMGKAWAFVKKTA